MSIGFIIASVIAVMHMNGWELGITESMTIVILIGIFQLIKLIKK